MTRAGRICRARGESNARGVRDCRHRGHRLLIRYARRSRRGRADAGIRPPRVARRLLWQADPHARPHRPHAVASPIQRYLERLHARHAGVVTGEVATYIPELGKADPDWFGDLPRHDRRPGLRGRRVAPDLHDSIDLQADHLRPGARGPGLRGGARQGRRRAERRRVQLDQPRSRDRLSAEPDDQRRGDRDDVARGRTLGRGPPRAPAHRLFALRRPPSRDRRVGVSLREGDRTSQSRDRPHAPELRRPDG